MNSILLKRVGISLAAMSGIVLAASLFTTSQVRADQWDKMTLLTTNEPIQVGNTYLDPGTYMFKLADSNRHIVQIFNRDRSHLYNTIIAIPNYRVNVTSDPQFTFWETPPGTAKALRAWFYPGDNFGQEFAYPTQLRQIALLTPAPAPVPPPPPPPPPVVTEPQPAPPEAEAAPAPEAAVEPPAEEQEQVEIAQNTPPPPPEPAPALAPAPPEQQAQPDTNANALPQTASPYPSIGLCGLLALGLYFGLKMKQLS